MAYIFSNDNLERAVDKLLDKMISLRLIRPHEKADLVDKVTRALNAAYDNDVPVNLFTNPAQQKQLMSLVVCASIERTVERSNVYQDPKFANTFNTQELAKAMFTPDGNVQQAKLQLSHFSLALLPPAPGAKKKADELAELMLTQKQYANDNNHALDDTLNAILTAKLSAYLYLMQKQAILAEKANLDEYNYVQAFGDSPDGSPLVVSGGQMSNAPGFIDPSNLVTGGAGFLNQANDINNPNLNKDILEQLEKNETALGEDMHTFAKDLAHDNIIPKSCLPPTPGPV